MVLLWAKNLPIASERRKRRHPGLLDQGLASATRVEISMDGFGIGSPFRSIRMARISRLPTSSRPPHRDRLMFAISYRQRATAKSGGTGQSARHYRPGKPSADCPHGTVAGKPGATRPNFAAGHASIGKIVKNDADRKPARRLPSYGYPNKTLRTQRTQQHDRCRHLLAC